MSSARSNRLAWIVAGVAITGMSLLLGFLLVFATQNSERLEPHFGWLFGVNAAIASALVLVIVAALGRLVIRLRNRKFGSKLLLKLAGIFGLVAVVPGVLIYTVSYQFVSRSIETWFDVRVEGALEAGLNLGRSTLDALSSDLANKTQLAAERLGETGSSLYSDGSPGVLALERVREQLGAQSVALVSENGLVEVAAGTNDTTTLTSERVSLSWRQEARSKGVFSIIEGLEDKEQDEAPAPAAAAGEPARVIALAWLPDRSYSLQSKGHYLLVTQKMRADLVRNALDVQRAYSEYQQRSLGRQGLRRMYIGTLTLALVLAVFGAFLLAATLGQQLARPLLLLAEGVDKVAKGDLSPKAIFATRDELGGLTRSFAAMTQQLADARSLADRSVLELDSARAYLQTILDNLTAGVIVFDRQGRIDTLNPSATRILRAPLSAYLGKRLSEVEGLEDFAQALKARFELYDSDPTPGERQQWQESFELQMGADKVGITLLARGADLPPDAKLIVFDDISDVVSAQRTEAWSEVARRVAHEIKNPLTPIQLSAERLQMKLESKLDDAGQQLLKRSTDTIVTQVQALKTLINEFRDYARLPSAKLSPLDLNALVNDVLGLYGQALDEGTLVTDLTPDLPPIMGDPTLLRQVVHNLVQNGLDVIAEHPPQNTSGKVLIRTDLSRLPDGTIRAVKLVVRDNGPGFPEKILKRAFEPYVTTKAKGTGLGLAVVKKIADEHGALIRLRNIESTGKDLWSGAQVSLSFSKLSSTLPQAGS